MNTNSYSILSDTWVASNPSSFRFMGGSEGYDNFGFQTVAIPGAHWLFLNRAFQKTFTISFTESRPRGGPEVTVRWLHDPNIPNRKIAYHGALFLRGDDSATIDVATQQKQITQPAGRDFKGFVSGSAEIISSGCHSGTYCLRDRGGAYIHRDVKLRPGRYRFSAWVKPDPSRNASPVFIGAKNYGGPEVQNASGAADYTQVAVEFSVRSAQTPQLYIYLPEQNAGMLIDDVALETVGISKEIFSSGFESGTLADPDDISGQPLVRRWKIMVTSDKTTIYLDDAPIFSGRHNKTDIPISTFSFQQNTQTGNTPVEFSQIKVTGTEIQSTLRILQLPRQNRFGGSDRILLLADSALKDSDPATVAAAGNLFHKIEDYGNSMLVDDPVISLWSFRNGGGNDSWVLVPDWTMPYTQTPAHEIAHWLQCSGGSCDWMDQMWLYEGFADYVGIIALNECMGLPKWLFRSHFLPLSPKFVRGGNLDVPLAMGKNKVPFRYGGESARQGMSYIKSHMFFTLLSELAGYENLQAVIRENRRAGKTVTAESLLGDLQARSGKDLQSLVAGWLQPGAYAGYSPTDFADTDKDGIVDLQEKLRGLNPNAADSDGDGVNDLEELRRGTDPLNASSR